MNEQPLTPERKDELLSAFNGANSLVLLFVYLILTALPIWWISDKMTGWVQLSGLVLLSLFTAFILMLFLTGLVKSILKVIFSLLSKDYKTLFNTNKK